ncbi:MAG TPA: hypothetical protein VFA89_06880 [Terriglobales bacterium]|nr:hypothetical protein [Terriglobales bacterium]
MALCAATLITCFYLALSSAGAVGTSLSSHGAADEIVAKNIDARGGLAAWRAVQSMSMLGHIEAGKGLEVPFRLELKRPRKMRLEIVFQGQTAVQVYDGKTGSKLRPFLGRSTVEPLSAEEQQAAAAQLSLDGPFVDYVAKGYKIELAGREPVEEHDAYKIKLTLEEGAVRHIWLDAASLLEVKMEEVRPLRGTQRRITTYYRDYRPVSGLVIPHVLETVAEGVPGRHKLTIEKVELNPQLADSRFTKP